MPTFPTPRPITATIEVSGGDVRITASDRNDTVVTVRPRDEGKTQDVQTARAVQVEHGNGGLTVKGQKPWRQIKPFGAFGQADITIELPTGSEVNVSTAMGKVHLEGELGRFKAKTAMGDVTADRVGTASIKTAYGDVRVDEVGGDLEVATASGELRIGRVHGSAVAKNSNGATTLGHVTGDVRVKSANGQITVERADANVVCKTAHGRTVIGEVRQGEVTIAAAAGGIDIGIAAGTAAWLDLNSQFGQVLNELEVSDGPGSSDRTVKVTAKTYSGDIVVRRSSSATADGPSAA